MLSFGRRLAHTAGRSGFPNNAQRKSARNCTHLTPAGLPSGMPGIGDEIEGAMQHAPQPERQFMKRKGIGHEEARKSIKTVPKLFVPLCAFLWP
jgi:hypothetical protein